jgi:hypothetical protein
MARKVKMIRIPADPPSRDAGKTFQLTEMSAAQSEKWALRALGAIANSGMEIPEDVMRLGMGALVAVGFKGLLTMQFDEAEPLLDEMMDCIVIVPDPKNPGVVRPVDDEDIEDVTTRLTLRSEVFELHTGFSPAGFLSKLGTSAKQTPVTSDLPTSPKPSATPSPADGQP